MDDDVERLVREQRLVEAAELAQARGDATRASVLFEKACDFGRAASTALDAADFARALPLALEGRRTEVAERALPELAKSPTDAERVAFHLERRGDHLWAARLFEALDKKAAAARAYERGGDARKAAELLEADGDVVAAARVLEGATRRDPNEHALHVSLGGLLLRYGKTDAAIRSLQRVPEGATERRAALTLLVSALDRVGLGEARMLAESELTTLGGAIPAERPSQKLVELRTRLFGRYEVVREVASSPSARVLEARDTVRGERIALKIFAGHDARGAGRDAIARFEREVRVLGGIAHPNVVPLLDYIAEGPALALAWMTGGTLQQMLAQTAITPRRAVEIAEAVLAALGEAHRLGVIHRDVKPANVLFDDAGVTRLGDFGVAHLGDLSATATAGVIGTLGYMSPEQREGRPASVASDLYGVGALLWEMLTLEPPNAGRDETTSRVRPSGVHRDLDARHDEVVLAFLAHDPARRPADAFAARDVLRALPWPDTLETVRPPQPAAPRSLRGEDVRLVEVDGVAYDRLLGRSISVVPLDETSLARASAFARADHPALQTVLRVDRSGGVIWLAAVRGAPLSSALGVPQMTVLREALGRLHAIGEIHGMVDRDHVFVDGEGRVTLAFAPRPAPGHTADIDRLALAALAT